MLIDWFTVAAQVVNFLILVWLLKRFLYKPVLAAIEAREKRIAERMESAHNAETEAEAAKSDYARRSAEIESSRNDLLSRAGSEAEMERGRLVDSARAEVEELRRSGRAAVASERAELIAELSARTRDEVFSIARKALADLADADLEERMISAFVDRLHAVDDERKKKLAATATGEIPVIRSAFELSDGGRAALEHVAQELLGAGVAVRFETAPGVIAGIELAAGGYSVAWSIASYLEQMEASVGIILGAPQAPAPAQMPTAAPTQVQSAAGGPQ